MFTEGESNKKQVKQDPRKAQECEVKGTTEGRGKERGP